MTVETDRADAEVDMSDGKATLGAKRNKESPARRMA